MQKIKFKQYTTANNWVIRSFVNELINRNPRSILMILYNLLTLVDDSVWHRVFKTLSREIFALLIDYNPREAELKKIHYNFLKIIKEYL